MNRRSRSAIVLAAILAALLLLGTVGPLILGSAGASWYDSVGLFIPQPYVDPGHNGRYFENTYSPDSNADMGRYHGAPVVGGVSMEISKDGNVKFIAGVRDRYELSYAWQAWSNKGTASLDDDGWSALKEADTISFRPADFLMNGTHMVRVTVAHRSGGSAVSAPVILTLTDGAGDNEGFTGSLGELIESARHAGYYSAVFVTDEGLVEKPTDSAS